MICNKVVFGVETVDIKLPGEIEALSARVTELERRLDGLDRPATSDGTWSVYRIYPDDLPSQTFYIGLTGDIHLQATQHNCDHGGPAFMRMRELERVGIDCTLAIVATFTERSVARQFETFLIATTPGLRNRDVDLCRKRLGVV